MLVGVGGLIWVLYLVRGMGNIRCGLMVEVYFEVFSILLDFCASGW